MIETNILYNFEDLRTLILTKAKVGTYYLLFDDIYFEQIQKNGLITRDIFTLAKQIVEPLNIIKYITFKTKEKNSTKEIYDLVELLRKTTDIIVTIFNPKTNEVVIIFIANKDDSILEKHVKTSIELEAI